MLKVFKKRISLVHSQRDYDDQFSSVHDVLSPLSTAKFFESSASNPLSPNLTGFKSFGSARNNKTMQKLGSIAIDKGEQGASDDLDNSFIKTNAEFRYHGKIFVFCRKSLYIFGENDRIRKFAVWLTESPIFELCMLAIIIANAVVLGMIDYNGLTKRQSLDQAYTYINPVLAVIFAIEAFLKVMARGFASAPNSFLRSGWNWIDLFVTISQVLAFEESLHYFSILRIGRIIRFLRPFKHFKRIDDMLSIMSTSFFLLLSIMALLVFFMVIFSIVGLNLYSGLLDFRCRLTPLPVDGAWVPSPDILRICGDTFSCPADLTCGSSYVYADMIIDQNDTFYEEFNWGITNFDNIFQSLFTVFVILNGNWENLLQMLSDATNNLLPLIYFFITFIVCRFFIVQLAVAVMLDNYTKIKERENPKKLYLTSNQVGKVEDADNQTDIMSDKPKQTLRERWRVFCQKYFPPVIVPPDEYYQNPFCSYAYQLTFHAMFKYVTIGLIVLNLVVIIMDRTPIDSWEYQVIVKANYILTILYIVEVSLKIIAQSVHKYFQDNFNILEFIIALISMIEISSSNGISALSSLRGLRLLRFMKKEYSWDNFKILITVVFEGSVYIIDFSIVLGLYMYAFAVLGMKYFAGTFKFALDGTVDLVNGFTPRANFDSLPEAFTVVFQVIVGENFLGVVLSAIRAVGWGSIAYFLILIIVGKYLLVQLFLAIILGAFGQAREQTNYQHLASRFIISKILKKKKPRGLNFKSIFPLSSPGKSGDKSLSSMIEKHRAQIKDQAELDLQESWAKDFNKARDKLEDEIEMMHPHGSQDLTKDSSRRPLVRRITREIFKDVHPPKESAFSRAKTLKVHPEDIVAPPLVRKLTRRVGRTQRTWILLKIQHIRESSLFIFHKDNKLRIFAERIIRHQVWETLILACILVSSILLMLDSPLDDPTTTASNVYDIMDMIFTILFFVEMILKIISYGFLFNYEDDEKAYLRSVWNLLDCFVVITSALDILTGGDIGLKSLKSLRALRALRPLRVISRNEDLKIIVNALFRTIPSLKNLTIVAGLIMIMGATIGTGYFKGKFNYCASSTDGSSFNLPTIVTKQDCLNAGGVWNGAISNYDNFLQAMLTYFQMIIGEGWVNALYSGVDSVGVDMQPKHWTRASVLVYFYLFLLIGNVLIKNLFVGVVIDNFRQMKEELSGMLFLNEMQRDWTEMQIFMQRKKLKRVVPEPENFIRKICFKIAQSEQFENIMILLVVLNTIVLGLTFKGQSSTFSSINEKLNYVFLGIFHLEAFIGIVGLGIFYFKEGWNKFDIVILLFTDAVLIFSLTLTDGSNFGTIPTVIRSLRLGRIVKFIRASRHVRVLVDTLYYLLPSLANIGMLLILMMFIYAVLGINLFAGIKLQTHVNQHANFQDLLGALNIMIRCCLGQDWYYFMMELSNANISGCQDNQSFQDMQKNGIIGCGTFLAYPYFLSYIIIITLILINLFLAIVVGGYIESKKENEAVISPNQMEEFLDKWVEYDPQGSGLITPEQYAFLIHDMPHPFGLKDSGSVKYEYDLTAKKNKGHLISENGKIVLKRIQLLRDMHRFDIPVYSGRVHFSDACRVISYNAVIRAYKNDSRLSEHNELIMKGGSVGKIEERIEHSLAEKIRIKSEYVNKTLAKGWLNHFSVLKKLHREAKTANQKGLPPVHVTNYYAGKYIHEFWNKWKEDKRLNELQLIERKGVDYEKTFELQQRLANVKVAKMQTMKRGKLRLFEKNSRRTMQSVNSMGGMKEQKVASGEPTTPREVSLVSEGTPRNDRSRQSFCSIVEEGSNQSIGKGNLEKLNEYRNNKKQGGFKQRRASLMSSFAPLKSPTNISSNDFWLQNVSPSEKFPVPVTIEIDKFMLNYLDQSPNSRTNSITSDNSESMTSESEESVSSKEVDNSKEETPTSEPSSTSSEHAKLSARNENKSPKDKVSPRRDGEGGGANVETKFAFGGITIEEVESKPREIESKPKDNLFLPVKGNFLEIIEEKHEEDATSKLEIDNSPRKHVTAQSRPAFPSFPSKMQTFMQQKLETGVDSPFHPPEKGLNTLSIISLEGSDDPDKKDKQANSKPSTFGSKSGLGGSIGEGIESKDKKS